MHKRILIVDDNASVRRLLRAAFEQPGWEVAEAVNGREAIDKAELNPDLIVLDLSMPIMNGLQAGPRAQAHAAHRSDHLVYALWE